jgi:NADH-quinone oxidoreductase subunit E
VARAAAEAAARGDLEARLVDMEAAAVEYRARAEAAERRLRVLQPTSDSPEPIEAAAPVLADVVAEQGAPAERELQTREIESLRAQLALAERARAKSEYDLAVAQARAEEAARAGAAAPAMVEEGERPPGLAAPRGGKADDLRRIKGIGPRNEGVLNSLGLYHYEQIAALTPANIAWLDAYLKFPGRIARDDWVGQAKALLGQEQQPTDKVHPHDAGA